MEILNKWMSSNCKSKHTSNAKKSIFANPIETFNGIKKHERPTLPKLILVEVGHILSKLTILWNYKLQSEYLLKAGKEIHLKNNVDHFGFKYGIFCPFGSFMAIFVIFGYTHTYTHIHTYTNKNTQLNKFV